MDNTNKKTAKENNMEDKNIDFNKTSKIQLAQFLSREGFEEEEIDTLSFSDMVSYLKDSGYKQVNKND